MKNNNDIDIQCRMILEGLNTIKSITKKNLAKELLELETNLISGKNYNYLFRLEKSLSQYIDRKKDLFYIGFMGHFSSGKSSTINSVLNIWSHEKKRKIDLNPTDKDITLITHSKNVDSLINMIREGLIPIRSVNINNNFLSNIVLADTPGSGDPLLINEMMKDFLPICDVVYYFFSAANALDETDLPLLNAKQTQLPFLPIRFVITRADEFRKNFDEPLSDTNYDEVNSKKFVGNVLSRIKESVKNSKDLTKDHFTVIDNKKEFNIEKLVHSLSKDADINDLDNRIKLNSHKINYYRRNSSQIAHVFANITKEKIEILKSFVDEAKENINRYQDKVKISNNRLTELWKDKLDKLLEIKNKCIEDINLVETDTDYPNDSWDLPEIIQWKKELLNLDVLDQAKYIYDDILFDMKNQLKPFIIGLFEKISNSDYFSDYSPVSLGDITIEVSLNNKIRNPENFRNLFSNLVIIQFKKLESLKNKLANNINSINKMIGQFRPIKDYKEVIEQSIEVLDNDIEAYFGQVYIYRSGVFSLRVKQYISRLGIGERLDKLEKEFDSSFKEEITIEARKILFPEKRSIIEGCELELKKIKEKIRKIKINFKNLNIKSLETESIPLETITNQKSDELKRKIVDIFNKRVKHNFKGAFNEIEKNTDKRIGEYDNILKELKRKSINFFSTTILLTGVSTLIIFLFFTFDYVSNQKVSEALIISIFTTLCGNFIGYLIAKNIDNFPKTKKEKKNLFQKNLTNENSEILSKYASNIIDDQEEIDIVNKFLKQCLVDHLEQIKISSYNASFEKKYEELKSIHSNYCNIQYEYVENINQLFEKYSNYFKNDNSNLEKLDNISRKIKKVAIEPSFQFIDDLNKKLTSLNQELLNVKFS